MRRKLLYSLMIWLILGWVLAALLMNRCFMIGLVDYAMLYQETKANPQLLQSNIGKGILWLVFYRGIETLGILWLCGGEKRRWTIPLLFATIGYVWGTAFVLCLWNHHWWGVFWFAKEYALPSAPFYLLWWILIRPFRVVR